MDLANLSITDNKADIAGTVKGGGIGQASSGPSSDHVFADLDAFGRAKTNGYIYIYQSVIILYILI